MRYRHILLAAAAVALATGAANAQDKKINIKLSYWVPPSHLLTPGYKEWADEVTKLSNGSITVTLFPSSQLGSGPDHYDMVKRGVADFGLINPGYTPGRFPVIGVADLPFMSDGQHQGRAGDGALVQEVRREGDAGSLRLPRLLARARHLPLQEGDQGSGRREGHERAHRQPDDRAAT